MKTKHLFLATALMASFAACTNEEIVSDVQQNVATGRPTVENVKLTFGDGVESRLEYNKGWKWEATDQIGALLMDQPTVKWHVANTPWNDKYELSHHIHTSYPFSYNAEDGTWGTPGKMLEGNYFFAYPYESYEGQRMVAHSLIDQKQEGITADVRAKSYADNQFFIGYDRIIAGTQDTEALNNVSMTSVLGAIELRIVNTGTQTYNINKVVLSGDKLASQLTFDPTNLNYSYLNETVFNSANYLDLDEEDAWTLDEDYNAKYDKDAALRAVVNPVADEKNDKFAQIIIEGEERALLPDAGNTAYVLIMANPVSKGDLNNLVLSIYTDEGMVAGINLKNINKASSKYGYVTNAKVEEIHPEVKNVIEIQIDDNAFEIPSDMEIFNSQDLEQFIVWNSKISGKREITATLAKDVTLTEAAYEALVGKNNLELTITSKTDETANTKAAVLTLAEELPTNVLDNENLIIKALTGTYLPAVKALCDIEWTKDSEIPAYVEVAKDATFTLAKAIKVAVPAIVNYGTLEIGEKANIKNENDGTITNKGTMNVAEGAYVKNGVVNEGTLNNNGEMPNVNKNDEKAVIVLGEEAVLTVTNNYGKITTDEDTEVTVTNNYGEVVYEGGEISVTNKEDGITVAELKGTVDEETTEDLGSVNTWRLTGDTKFKDADKSLSYATVIVEDGVEVTVDKDTKDGFITIATLIIEGDATIEGTINFNELVVEEDGYLTIAEDALLEGKDATDKEAAITNEGVIKNNGTVYLPDTDNYEETADADWRGDDLEETPATVTAQTKQDVMDNAVKTWFKYIKTWSGTTFTDFYGYEVTVEKFIDTMKEWNKHYLAGDRNDYATAANAFASAKALSTSTSTLWGIDYNKDAADASSIESKLMPNGVACSEFGTALTTYLSDEKTAFDATWTKQYTGDLNFADGETLGYELDESKNQILFESKTDAYDKVRKFMAEPGNLKTDYPGAAAASVAAWNELNDIELFAAAWLKTDDEIETVLEKTTVTVTVANGTGTEEKQIFASYLYIYEGCPLYEVMQVVKKQDVSGWNSSLFAEGEKNAHAIKTDVDLNTLEGVRAWMDAVYYANGANSGAKTDALSIYERYAETIADWQYTNKQVVACKK